MIISPAALATPLIPRARTNIAIARNFMITSPELINLFL
jgi:hypothetical protein